MVADGKFVIGIGGEHAITTGLVQGYLESINEPFTVVQIDAHGDMRHEFEGSIHNHACVMRRVLELGLPTLPVGIRAICQEEADLIKEKKHSCHLGKGYLLQPPLDKPSLRKNHHQKSIYNHGFRWFRS